MAAATRAFGPRVTTIRSAPFALGISSLDRSPAPDTGRDLFPYCAISQVIVTAAVTPTSPPSTGTGAASKAASIRYIGMGGA